MRVIVVRNAGSGTTRRRKQLDTLVSGLKAHGARVDIEAPDSAEATRAVAADVNLDNYDVLVVAGGDGTLHAAVNGLVNVLKNRRPPLAILPVGRGNDFAAELGLKTIEDTFASIVDNRRTRVDLGKTEAGVFLGVAGAGFDAQTARRAQKTPFLSGSLLYSYAAFRTLLEFRHIDARIGYDGGFYEGPITFAAVGNSRRYGGGMRIAPRAELDDGLLDLCLVRDISRLGLVSMFPTVFSGRHLGHRSVDYRQTRHVTIETTEPAEVFADGEYLQQTPTRIDVLAGELEVLTHASVLR
jgi:diacylglycerol kinase (ATP)